MQQYDVDGYMLRNYPGLPYSVVRDEDGNLMPSGTGFTVPSIAEMEADYATEVAAGTYADWTNFAKVSLGSALVQRISTDYVSDVTITNLAQYCMLVGIAEVELPTSYIQSLWLQLLTATGLAGFEPTAEEMQQWNALVDSYRLGSFMRLGV